MDKYEIINRIIVDLDHLTVQGAGNMAVVLRSIDGLRVLTETLKKKEANEDEHASAE